MCVTLLGMGCDRPRQVLVAHSSFIEGYHTTKNIASEDKLLAWLHLALLVKGKHPLYLNIRKVYIHLILKLSKYL